MSDYFSLVKSTYIESWPDSLMRLSFSTELLPLSAEDVEILLAYYDLGNGEGDCTADMQTRMGLLSKRIDVAINHFPRGAFVRLGSRSPKDSWRGYKDGFCCKDGDKAIALLTESERVADDLRLAQLNGYQPYMAVREWANIPWHQEFRCFIKDGCVVGVSQYNYHKVYPRDNGVADEETIRWVVDTFFDDYLKPSLHLDPVIADLWIRMKGYDNTRVWEIKLVEINPFVTYTDPCLFGWRDADVWTRKEPYEIRLKDA